MSKPKYKYFQGKGSFMLFLLGWLIFKVSGWKTIGRELIPEVPKAIGVFAPHTSIWDVFWLLSYMVYYRLRANWLVREESTRGFWGLIVKNLGGIPVDRSRNTGMVQQVVEEIERADKMYLVLSPEGTRKKTDHWKTGFYYIAKESGLTLTMMYVDYAKKEVGFGPTITPSGDIEADMETMRAFFSTVTPKHPEKLSECRVPSKTRSGAA